MTGRMQGVELGSVFARDFRIEGRLGSGGMGSVFAVRQLSTGHRRALKVMHAPLLDDEESRARFTAEARIGARVPSDHVVEVVAAGVDEASRVPWLAMELLDGENLEERVARLGHLSPGEAADVFEELGHALGAAHSQGIVHRDLKPENLFLSRVRRARAREELKVLDFGIAKTLRSTVAESTATSTVGTPLWMAPEQTAERTRIGPATDVWALGLVAFYVLTGRHYWRSADPASGGVHALLVEIGTQPFEPASVRAPAVGSSAELPPGFDEWFAACVARDQSARIPDGRTACDRLVAILRAAAPTERRREGAAPTLSSSELELAETLSAEPDEPFRDESPEIVPAAADAASAAPSAPSRTPEILDVSSPREALELIELRRTKTFSRLVLVLVLSVFVAIAVIDAPTTTRAVHAVGILPIGLYAAWLAVVLRDESRWRSWMPSVFAALAGVACASTFPFWGVFSSAVAVVPIAIYFFASGAQRGPVIAALVGAAGPHAILGWMVASGLADDLGIIRPIGLGVVEAAIVLGIAQFLFVIAYLLARAHRKSTEESLERLEAATRRVAQRQALLDEARLELERALKVGGPGRFTDQVVGSFRLGNLIGRGGMGEVYEAAHVESGQPAAVKLLSSSAAREPGTVERFAREVRISASLDSPNVVRVLEVPRKGLGAMPFLVMERLRGATLSDILRDRTRLSLEETVVLVSAISHGLSAAHLAGIVHRDVKPQNLFAHEPPDGTRVWKILDFGVSRLAGADTITRNQLLGTPGYMSPEQAAGGEVDERSDLYALGVVAYRALTGRPAFAGSDAAAVLYAVATRMPPPPPASLRRLRGLEPVLAIAMAKAPADRFQSADEMRAAFEALGRGEVSIEIRRRGAALLSRSPWSRERDPSALPGRTGSPVAVP